ncbi:lecithin retinol acyltransferase family protein [Candidatus Synechococcus calcipolaris G9]|uniref:Lecithin retinol acyltransferase family protein n=1 Tax=Candidatus Synechococcus calcipolaris G9 TaxID=1497997 RepID=A0ABT6EYL8_9SYNE|nr:lecithin retinol acyltransferase family protein [Candidatus Synechococcus calcipolaris]MDG2990842.1 lecithin retinol acyltransferase family protein [Candidatus Synechococcus calcipolaris G9]
MSSFTPKVGDHIYYGCGTHAHHGIYCGDFMYKERTFKDVVIHCEGKAKGGRIKGLSYTKFAAGHDVKLVKYAPGACFDTETVVKRAISRLGEYGYDLLDNNCEHFATWCKTGKHKSEQVEHGVAVGAGAPLAGAAVAGSLGVVSGVGAAAGLSGAGIMSGLATVGGVVGGGAVAGVGALGALPALATTGMMYNVLNDDESLPQDERDARSAGRVATTAGAVGGSALALGAIAGAGTAGVSAAGITSGLAAIGGTVGGGMAAGVGLTVAAPAVAAAALGFGVYKAWQWLSE